MHPLLYILTCEDSVEQDWQDLPAVTSLCVENHQIVLVQLHGLNRTDECYLKRFKHTSSIILLLIHIFDMNTVK